MAWPNGDIIFGPAKAGFDGGWMWRVVLPDAGAAGEARGGRGASDATTP